MFQLLANAVPQLVLLLVISPGIGVALLLAGRRQTSESQAQFFAFGNAVVTAVVGTCLFLVASSNLQIDPTTAGTTLPQAQTVLAVWAPSAITPHLPPWALALVLSVGWDELNAGVLFWIPWLFVAILLALPEPKRNFRGILIGLLAAEGFLLLEFAAQDAWTFCAAGEAGLLILWSSTGLWGDEHRRDAAHASFSWQHTGLLCWMLGLAGLGIVSVWLQLEARGSQAVIGLQWNELAPFIAGAKDHHLHRDTYWGHAASIIMTALLAGTVLQSGLFPAHHAWSDTLEHAAYSIGAVLIGGYGLLGGYGYFRFVAPLVELGDTTSWFLLALGGATALLGGLLTIAQSDPRRCLSGWWIATAGSCWLGLASDVRAAQVGSWRTLQIVVGAGVALVLLLQTMERCRPINVGLLQRGLRTSSPRLAWGGLLLTFVALVLLPMAWVNNAYPGWVWAFARLPAATWAAVAGLLLAGWGLVTCLRTVLFGATPSPRIADGPTIIDVVPATAASDLSWREGLAFVIVLGVPWLAWGVNFWRSLP